MGIVPLPEEVHEAVRTHGAVAWRKYEGHHYDGPTAEDLDRIFALDVEFTHVKVVCDDGQDFGHLQATMHMHTGPDVVLNFAWHETMQSIGYDPIPSGPFADMSKWMTSMFTVHAFLALLANHLVTPENPLEHWDRLLTILRGSAQKSDELTLKVNYWATRLHATDPHVQGVALHRLAEDLEAIGLFVEAARVYTKAITVDPQRKDLFTVNAAVAYRRGGAYDKAEVLWLVGVRSFADMAPWWATMVTLYRSAHAWTEVRCMCSLIRIGGVEKLREHAASPSTFRAAMRRLTANLPYSYTIKRLAGPSREDDLAAARRQKMHRETQVTIPRRPKDKVAPQRAADPEWQARVMANLTKAKEEEAGKERARKARAKKTREEAPKEEPNKVPTPRRVSKKKTSRSGSDRRIAKLIGVERQRAHEEELRQKEERRVAECEVRLEALRLSDAIGRG